MVLLMALYGYCVDATLRDKLYHLNENKQEDFFVQTSNDTQKYFVSKAIELSYQAMHEEVEKYENVKNLDEIKFELSNFQALTTRNVKEESELQEDKESIINNSTKSDAYGGGIAGRLLQPKYLDKMYNLFNLPHGVPLEFIKMIERHTGPREDWVFIIFKCKNEGDTIFTPQNVMEMDNFVGEITKGELWPKLCTREDTDHLADGYHCGSSSYSNLTRLIKQRLDLDDFTLQSQLDEVMLNLSSYIT